MIENFLTTEQVAKILQVHPFTILKFLKSGKLRGVKLGRVYRIKESDVQAFLDSRMTGVSKFQKDDWPSSQNTTPQPVPHNDSHKPMGSYESESAPYSTSLKPSASSENETAPEPFPQSFLQSQHLPKTHSAIPDPYTIRKDENREDGPPHYVI